MECRQSTGRRLKLNHSNALPRYIVAYDTETLPEQIDADGKHRSHRFRLGCALCAQLRGTAVCSLKSERFTTGEQFWQFVRRITAPNYTVWIVMHNAIFDLVVSGLTEWHAKSEIVVDWPRAVRKRENNDDDDSHQVGSVIINSPPTIIAMRDTVSQGRFVIIDTMNYFPGTLAELGKAASIPKLPMPAFDAPDSEWFDYCDRDCQITFTAFTELVRWVKNNDFGMFRYTGPAQAMSAYRHRFMTHDILMHDNQEVKAMERRGYFGGRTEVFKLGAINETVYQLDCNALFPAVMADGFFPTKLNRYEIREEYLSLLPSVQWDNCTAEVLLKTSEPIFPKRQIGKVTFPIGQFATVLNGPELSYAVRKGYVKAVRYWAEYTTGTIFANWVAELWKMRRQYTEEKNGLYADFCKRLMNSLYGKFAQLAADWVNDPTVTPWLPFTQWHDINAVTGERIEYRSFGWTTQRLQEKRTLKERPIIIDGVPAIEISEVCNELPNTFVAISGFVTAYARMRMNSLRRIAGERNVYYQGVDGLIVTEPGFERLSIAGEVEPSELGKLRLLAAVSEGEIYGCSDYRLDDKVVISGRASSEIDKATGEILQRKFAGVAMLFRGKLESTIDEHLEPWSRQSSYTKGVVQADGWVEPLVLAEGVVPDEPLAPSC